MLAISNQNPQWVSDAGDDPHYEYLSGTILRVEVPGIPRIRSSTGTRRTYIQYTSAGHRIPLVRGGRRTCILVRSTSKD